MKRICKWQLHGQISRLQFLSVLLFANALLPSSSDLFPERAADQRRRENDPLFRADIKMILTTGSSQYYYNLRGRCRRRQLCGIPRHGFMAQVWHTESRESRSNMVYYAASEAAAEQEEKPPPAAAQRNKPNCINSMPAAATK